MADAACARGAVHVTVADVVACAGVSRRTFYELFSDCQECLLAALEEALERAASCVRVAYDPQALWHVRIRDALVAILCFLDEEPSRGRLLVVESLRLGPEVLARRAAVLAPIVREIEAGPSPSRGDPPAPTGSGASAPVFGGPPSLTAEGLVGAVLTVVHSRMTAERSEPLAELASSLMGMIVLPYLGRAAARRELAKPPPERRPRHEAPARHEQLSDLPMRLTYRTLVILQTIASHPAASNRRIASLAGVSDQGQISKLLRRLERLGLIANTHASRGPGAPNAWTLTQRGAEIAFIEGAPS